MTGPGGDEVARLSVRVTPDTSKFAQELKAQLQKIKAEKTVEVKFDLDAAGLRAQLAALRVPSIKIPAEVKVDQSQLGQLGRLVADRKIKVEAEVDVDVDSLDNAIARASASARQVIKTRVEIDRDHFNRSIADLTRNSQKVKVEIDIDKDRAAAAFSGLIGTLTNAASGLGRTLGSFFDTASSGVGRFASGVTDAVSDVSGFAATIAKASAIATGLAVAGAGITAAWGAASTAVAAVPAAIALIGAPLASVLVGMDGIKKAAQTLKPAFDQLKASVSATFQQGLTPVFQQLKAIFPTLQAGLNGIAVSLSTVAQRTTAFITSARGTIQLNTLFQNVQRAIASIDLEPLISGFLTLAGNRAALDALAGTINRIGEAIQRIANNPALDAAFEGLEGTLGSLTDAFADLVNNGITLFANAAPGLSRVIDSIAGFFNKFDWAALGGAVSGALEGVASAIDGIDPATISAITTGFQGLSTALQSEAFKTGLQGFADAIPAALEAGKQLITVFGGIGTAVGIAARAFSGIDTAIQGLSDKINSIPEGFILDKILGKDNSARFQAWLLEADDAFDELLGIIPEKGAEGAAAAEEAGQGIHDGVVKPLAKTAPVVGQSLAPIAGQVRTSLAPVPGSAQGIFSKIPPGIAKELGLAAPAAKTAAEKVGPAVGVGLAPIPGFVNQAFVAIGPQINEAMAGLATYVSFGTVTLANAVTTGITTNLAPAFTTGFLGLAPIVDQAFAGLSVNAAMGMANFALGVTQGFLAVSFALQTGLIGLGPIVDAGFAGLSINVAMGMSNLALAVTTGALSINLALQTALLGLGPVIDQGFAGLSINVALGMANLALAVTTGALAMTLAFQTAFIGFGPIIDAGFAGLSINVAMGMVTIAAAVTTGAVAITAALQTALLALGPIVDQGFAGLSVNVAMGMNTMAEAVTTGFVAVNAAFTAGKDAAIAVVDPALANAMTIVGTNAMNALAAAILAGKSAVVNAMAQVIAAAIAQAQSALQIGSPSRVMGKLGDQTIAGYANHLRAGRDEVTAAMETALSGGIRAAEQASTALSLADVNAVVGGSFQNQIAASGQIGNDGASAGGDTFNITALPNATAVDLANQMSFRRRYARRGVHSGR